MEEETPPPAPPEPAGVAPATSEPSESADSGPLAPRPSRWPLVGLFLVGALSASLVVLPRRFPVQTYATWCQVRYGGLPSARGLLMSARPCPPALRGVAQAEPGTWVLLEYRNLEPAPSLLVLPELAGEELAFEVRADGVALEPRADPARESLAQALRPHLLAPGARLEIPADLSRYVTLPATWDRLEVKVLRAQLGGDGHTCAAETTLTRP